MPREQASPRVPELRWLRRREIWGAALGTLGLLGALALTSILRGAVGAAIVRFWRGLFGWGAYPVVLCVLAAALWLLARERLTGRAHLRPGQVVGLELCLLGCLGLLHIGFSRDEGFRLAERGAGGGYTGWVVASWLGSTVGRVPALLLLLAMIAAGAVLLLDRGWDLLEAVAGRFLPARRPAPFAPMPPPVPVEKPAPPPVRPTPRPVVRAEPAPVPAPRPAPAAQRPPRRRVRSAKLPPLDLLAPVSVLPEDDAEVRYQVQTIEETLAHFGVPARVVEVRRGPTVTQFGVEPGFIERRGPAGMVERRKVRVSRISSLAHDLALALAAPSIRIEAPVPGRPIVGIEVPHRKTSMVNLRSVVESEAYRKIRSPLRVALGQDVAGQPVAGDLASMPHLLIAGATGSGKSVCISALIACLLLENPPDALKLVLVDPKRVELTGFNGVPHLVAPVVVDVEQTVGALRWLGKEMDQRYQQFARLKVRNIEGYNAAVGRRKDERMPYLAVFIDELADLMMVAPEEVERSLCRLAQMGRATGIHLVVATQRPSIDVVTGLIKANFPSRIAFAVSTQVDSRVILDAAGAEQLLGRGDMLFMAADASRLVRLQGCFVSDAELEAIIGHWRQALEQGPDDEEEEAPWAGAVSADDEGDALLAEAIAMVRRQGQVSASWLQRKLRIGYTRAARLVEEMEARGVVGPDPGGGRPRPVLAAVPDTSSTDAAEDEVEP